MVQTHQLEFRGDIPKGDERIKFLKKINTVFKGNAATTDELTIFFKKDKLSLRINRTSMSLIVRPSETHEEVIFNVPLKEGRNLIRFLHTLGYSEGVISHCVRYDYVNSFGNFSMKLGTKVGDFWEFDKQIADIRILEYTQKTLREFLSDNLNIAPWDDSEYSQFKTRWSNVASEQLVMNGALHPQLEDIFNKYAK